MMFIHHRTRKDLQKKYLEVAFIPQPGKSDLVCSASISVEKALCKSNNLAQTLKSVAEQNNYEAWERPMPETDESRVLSAV